MMAAGIPDSKIIPDVDKVLMDYKGNANELEQAIGVWIVGRKFGWKVMLLVHARKTLAKYEKILGIDFREQLPEAGPLARSAAYLGILARPERHKPGRATGAGRLVNHGNGKALRPPGR